MGTLNRRRASGIAMLIMLAANWGSALAAVSVASTTCMESILLIEVLPII